MYIYIFIFIYVYTCGWVGGCGWVGDGWVWLSVGVGGWMGRVGGGGGGGGGGVAPPLTCPLQISPSDASSYDALALSCVFARFRSVCVYPVGAPRPSVRAALCGPCGPLSVPVPCDILWMMLG